MRALMVVLLVATAVVGCAHRRRGQPQQRDGERQHPAELAPPFDTARRTTVKAAKLLALPNVRPLTCIGATVRGPGHLFATSLG